MKKIFLLISMLVLVLSAQGAGRNNKNTQTSRNTMSAAAQAKSESLYQAVRKAYGSGQLSADGVVDKALYHNVWSPQLAERCLLLVSSSNPRAMAELGHLYTDFHTAYLFPGKEAEGVRLLQTASNQGNHDASDYLGVYYCQKDQYDKAKDEFNKAFPNNNPLALKYIAGMYDSGHGVKKDYSKAREYYRQSAMKGNAGAAAKYGLKLQRDFYGTVDMPAAFEWIYIGGDLGDDSARSNLELPLRGERFGDDQRTALMRRALAIGEEWNNMHKTKLRTSKLYNEGFAGGLSSMGKKAQSGDQWANFYLGSMSYNNEFLNRRYELVLECYEPLIKSNTLPKPALALVYERLGEMYRNGHGVKANKTKAAQYTRTAANLGSLPAYKIIENIPD
ncbi:MAG: sel1 repeat family protein [Barnesiella sp.]|nr:sel1 repeat family protein [Barnesiella sp.]